MEGPGTAQQLGRGRGRDAATPRLRAPYQPLPEISDRVPGTAGYALAQLVEGFVLLLLEIHRHYLCARSETLRDSTETLGNRVPGVGFEPTRPLGAAEFKSATTTSSVTRALVPFSHQEGRRAIG